LKKGKKKTRELKKQKHRNEIESEKAGNEATGRYKAIFVSY